MQLVILDILAIIFGLIIIIVSIMLLWDQYDTITNECTQCDYKRGILLEKSSVKQQLQMILSTWIISVQHLLIKRVKS